MTLEPLQALASIAVSLNAPFGARCFMTPTRLKMSWLFCRTCLNAPFGARCFMTTKETYAALTTPTES